MAGLFGEGDRCSHPERGQGGVGSTGVSSLRLWVGGVREFQEGGVLWRHSVNHTEEAFVVTGANKNRTR